MLRRAPRIRAARRSPSPRRSTPPVLACGAQLKNTFCIGRGREAVLGPHIGDLDSAAVYRDYETSIERLIQFMDVTPGIVAHDLHPDYLSTRYALGRNAAVTIGVQHHHAHVASVMAEHGLSGPVLGLAYDGTGYGTDGAAWGGELLLAGYDGVHAAGDVPAAAAARRRRGDPAAVAHSRWRWSTTRSRVRRRSTDSPYSGSCRPPTSTSSCA